MQTLVRIQNIAHRLDLSRTGKPLARGLELLIRFFFACYLPAAAKIHPSVHFEHNGLAVVVNKLSQIGPGCRIGPQVVLGGRSPIIGAPTLEEGVIVHSGAKIIGPIRIGKGAVIGANAVVLTDIRPGATAVGVPAREVIRP